MDEEKSNEPSHPGRACLETLEKVGSGSSGIPEVPCSSPLRRVAHPGLSVLGGLEWGDSRQRKPTLSFAPGFQTVPRAQDQICLMRTFMGVNFHQL